MGAAASLLGKAPRDSLGEHKSGPFQHWTTLCRRHGITAEFLPARSFAELALILNTALVARHPTPRSPPASASASEELQAPGSGFGFGPAAGPEEPSAAEEELLVVMAAVGPHFAIPFLKSTFWSPFLKVLKNGLRRAPAPIWAPGHLKCQSKTVLERPFWGAPQNQGPHLGPHFWTPVWTPFWAPFWSPFWKMTSGGPPGRSGPPAM